MENQKLELFAIVELFGHQKVAAKVSEQSVGSSVFIRLDIPETDTSQSFTRIVNPSAVYAINPVTEEVMKYKANELEQIPIEAWDIQRMQEKLLEMGKGKTGSNDHFLDENQSF